LNVKCCEIEIKILNSKLHQNNASDSEVDLDYNTHNETYLTFIFKDLTTKTNEIKQTNYFSESFLIDQNYSTPTIKRNDSKEIGVITKNFLNEIKFASSKNEFLTDMPFKFSDGNF